MSIYCYCVAKFETVFRGIIFWRSLIIPPIAPNKNACQNKYFTVHAIALAMQAFEQIANRYLGLGGSGFGSVSLLYY